MSYRRRQDLRTNSKNNKRRNESDLEFDKFNNNIQYRGKDNFLIKRRGKNQNGKKSKLK